MSAKVSDNRLSDFPKNLPIRKEVSKMSDLFVWISASDDDLIDLLCCEYNYYESGLDPLDDELIFAVIS